jgi:hypothetical protein
MERFAGEKSPVRSTMVADTALFSLPTLLLEIGTDNFQALSEK